MSCSQFGPSPSPSSASPQVLMPGQPVAVGPSPVVPAPSSPSSAPAAPPTSAPNLPVPSASSAAGVHACCESGRPLITDPITGQSLCSCQYDAQLLNYQRLTAGLPLNMYGTAAAAAAAAAAYGGEQGFLPLASEQSAFYSPTANGFDLKENLEAWRTLPYAASMYYPYDTAALAGYPFANGYGVDLNGARRKNATRETTSTLKAWLNEHRKNPYPTKGEKIMLAIITKMTLTQVSTWFANARRRLKKENKMTWSPRNRCDDDDDGDGDDGRSSKDDRDLKSPESHHKISHDLHRRQSECGDDRLKDTDLDDIRTDVVDIDEDSKSSEPGNHSLCRTLSLEKGVKSSSPVSDGTVGSDSESSQQSMLSPANGGSSGGSSSVTDLHPSAPKPRIWSIVDTATSGTATAVGGGASRLSPLQRAARLDYLSPYAKPPPSWYASSVGGQLNPGSVPGTFPLYSPMVHSSALVNSPGTDPVATSINRLRTAFGGASDLALGKSASGAPGFSFSGPRLLSSQGQSSGSSAALAAVTSMNPMTSVASRVVS